MKKLISILLICAMLLSFGITIAAGESGSGELRNTASDPVVVYKSARKTSSELGEDWRDDEGGVSLTDGKVGYLGNATESSYKGSEHNNFTIAHDGDYLYINVGAYFANKKSVGATANRHSNFVYIDFETGDTDINYKINIAAYSKPYGTSDAHVKYSPGYTDYGYTANGAKYALGCNDAGALTNGIVGARYTDKPTTDDTIILYNIVVPISEEVKTEIANGNCTIKIGYLYVQGFNTSGDACWYTNCGNVAGKLEGADTTKVAKMWDALYNSVTYDMLTSVTLSGATAEGEDTVATTTNLAGVQEPATKGDTFDIRLVGTLNISDDFANYKNVGFEITGANTLTSTTNSVYKTCLANDSTVPSWWYGGDYFYFTDITGVKLGTAYELTVKSFCTKADGSTVYGQEYKLTVDTAGNVALEAVN